MYFTDAKLINTVDDYVRHFALKPGQAQAYHSKETDHRTIGAGMSLANGLVRVTYHSEIEAPLDGIIIDYFLREKQVRFEQLSEWVRNDTLNSMSTLYTPSGRKTNDKVEFIVQADHTTKYYVTTDSESDRAEMTRLSIEGWSARRETVDPMMYEQKPVDALGDDEAVVIAASIYADMMYR
jgi:hypothetical protein